MTRTAVATDPGDGDGEWMSTADAARLLGITPRTLFRLIDSGDIPAYRFGRVIRIRQSDVERLGENMNTDPPETA